MNKAETRVAQRLIEDGCEVVRGGWPDFLVIAKDGTFRFVEVKDGRDELNEAQKNCHAALRRCGIVVDVIRPPDQTRTITFRPDSDVFEAMVWLRKRDGVPFSEQIRRALRMARKRAR